MSISLDPSEKEGPDFFLPTGTVHSFLASLARLALITMPTGQPVRYICQTRSGTVFFVVVFELVDVCTGLR